MRTKSVLTVFLVVSIVISLSEAGNYWARKGGNRHAVNPGHRYKSFKKRLGLDGDKAELNYQALEEWLANGLKRALDDGY